MSLKKLAYSDSILNSALTKAKKSHFRSLQNEKNVSKDPIDFKNCVVLPYVPCLDRANSSLKMIEKQVVFKYNSKLSSLLSNNRSSKSTHDEAAGVYRIDCAECDSCYIGETGRNLKIRVKEHKKDVRDYKPASGLAVHSNTKFHNFDFNNAKLLFNVMIWPKGM